MPVAIHPDSEFAHAVYAAVAAIPAGRVASYGDIARQAGFPRHARFVGRLMGRLPEDSRLPWWRVLRSDGRIALTGNNAERQRQRLEQEEVVLVGGRVDLGRFSAFR
ncbi:MAG: MGMT family protein [Alcanivoracaceae bacterium]|nr:MGMT family protein [Alcanivoracaceae bacterium]